VPQPALGETQEAPLVGTVEQHLGNRETDELAVRDPNGTTALPSARQEIIDEHVNVRQQCVEVGGHRGLLVDGM
jgi:hypothetical protein